MAVVVIIAVGVLLIGLLAGIVAGHFLMLPADRRRLEVMTDRLIFQVRQDAATRATVRQMRDVARSEWRAAP